MSAMKKTTAVFNMTALILIMLSLCFYIFSIFRMSIRQYTGLASWAGVLFVATAVAAVVLVSKLIKTDIRAILCCLILTLAELLIWNFIVQAQPVSDYELVWDGAGQIVAGTFQERVTGKDSIFVFCSYLAGYSYYLSLLNRLCHGSVLLASTIRLIIFAITNMVLYKTFRLYCGIRTSFCGTALFIFYPFIFIGTGIFNNQHEAMLFELLTVYLYLRITKKHKSSVIGWILIGISVCLADFFRPASIIILIAVVVLSLVKALVEKDISFLYGGIIVIATYVLLSFLINRLFIVTGMAPYGVKSSNFWFKLLLGLTGEGMTHQETVDAAHTNFYFDLQYYGFDYDAYRAAAAEYVKELALNKQIDPKFLYHNIVYFAGFADNQYTYLGSAFIDNHPFVTDTLNSSGLIIYFASVVFASVRCFTKKILSHGEIALPALIFGGYFLVQIVFEMQTRYRYEQYYMLFLLAVPAMAWAWRKAVLRFGNPKRDSADEEM